MRGRYAYRYYHYTPSNMLPIDDPTIDCVTAQRKMQRLLADKINNFAEIDELRLLLVSGARANVEVTLGLLPLHYAVYRNYYDAARLLIVRGARVDAVDDIGCSVLHMAAEKGSIKMLELLLQHIIDRDKCNRFESSDAPFPIRSGVDEPLRLAIMQDHFECAEMLLRAGADPNTRYFDGPELSLLEPTKLAYLRLLLDYGANPNAPSRHGLTPLMRSVECGIATFKTTQLLLERNADPNAINRKSGYPLTILHYAINGGHLQTVQLLLDHGAKVDFVGDIDEDESIGSQPTALHFAVMSGNVDMARLLLERGADPQIANSVYGSSLHLAACHRIGAQNYVELVQLLLEHGAQPNARIINSNGTMLLSPAVELFRRLYKYQIEHPTEHVSWTQIVALLFSYGAEYEITAENIDVRGLNTPSNLSQPDYATQLSNYVTSIATTISRDTPLNQPNAVYMSSTQLKSLLTSTRSLAQCCRRTIRALINVRPDVVAMLPLPSAARNYLLGVADLPLVS